jgi:prenyltransferase beta subunit
MSSTMSLQPDRRTMLKSMAAAGLAAAVTPLAFGRPDWRGTVTNYLATLARPDGGYAWHEKAESHLTPTFAVIGCHRLLKIEPPNKAKLVEFVRTHHPFQIKKLERDIRVFEFQQIQSLLWLGADASSFSQQVRGWKKPTAYNTRYETHGNPIFHNELTAFTCRELLGLPLTDLAPAFIEYLDTRRRANGSFNHTPAADGSGGHVMNTLWGLQALKALGRLGEKRTETIDWLRACQLPSGGFTIQPKSEIDASAVYTWAAVSALTLLDAEPADRAACVNYLRSLWTGEGAFADRPEWPGNPVATYQVLDGLATLGALDGPQPPTRPIPSTELPANLKVFSIQIEAHGQGSPAEAVDLAHALKIHMWGAKNAKPAWIARAQQLANARKVPVTFFVANEEYGTLVSVPGLGTYSHTSDIIAPSGSDFGPAVTGKNAVTWEEFRERRLAPLQKARGDLVWQFGENEELTRFYFDDSLRRGGYAAISTFHFGNPDFANSEPWLNHYRGRIPFIGLQDAHGPEPWWFADMTTGFRTLFLGQAATWDNWLTALKNNWVVAVRHDAVSGQKTWMHDGSRTVAEFVRAHEPDWRWWDNPAIQRPLVSIVAIKAGDPFEVAAPVKGLMVRVRCAWENTTQGQPKKPIAELVSLTIDGEDVTPTLVTKKRPNGNGVDDHYHQLHLLEPTPGKHTVRAVVRVVATKSESDRVIEFDTLGGTP